MPSSKSFKILAGVLIIMIMGIFAWGIVSSLLRPYGVRGAVEAEFVGKIAIEKKDISICDKIHLIALGDVTDFELREVCYESYARAHPDENICPNIANNFRCVDARASTLGDASICLAMENTDDKSLCVFDVAFKKHNPDVCDILTTPAEAGKCKRYYQQHL
jgi:hypothetical protein